MVRTDDLFLDDFLLAQKSLYSGLRVRKFRTISLVRSHQHQAVRLIKSYGPTQNLRTLDALQLAVALDLNNHTPLDHFVCADIPFCQIAMQEGLSVLNPEESS